MEIELSQAPFKHSVWDNYVPIVKEGRHTDAYFHNSIESPSYYTEICNMLKLAYEGDTVTIHFNNGGGYVDSGFMIVDAISKSKAVVTAYLSGSVASITTIIALSCAKVVVADYISWLSHNYSAGVQGKGGEMKAQMEFMSRELAISFKQLHKGFFTEAEMDAIIEDKDMWLNKSSILARWDARAKGDSKALEAIAASAKKV